MSDVLQGLDRWIERDDDGPLTRDYRRTCRRCGLEFRMSARDEYQVHVICPDCARERDLAREGKQA